MLNRTRRVLRAPRAQAGSAPVAGPPAGGRSRLFACLYFLLLAGLLLAPALRFGTILAPVDLYYETPVFAPRQPDDYVEPANPHLFDQAYQFVPWRYHAWERLRAADIPLWNPHSAAGTPFVATLQAAVFYPLNLLAAVLPFSVTFVFSAVLRLWIASVSTYLLMRRYGASEYAALLSGTSFMLSGFIVSWLGHPHTNVAVWLPALILAIEGLFTASTRAAALRWWALLAAVTGTQFLGGHIETSRDVLLAAGAYAIVRLVQQADVPLRPRLGSLIGAAAGVLAGACLAAIQLAPFLEWLPLSDEYQRRSGGGFDLLSFDLHPLLDLPLALMPNLYGNPTWPGEYWSFNPWGSFNESTLFAGIVPLGLAVATLTRWRADPVTRAWTIVGGLALALALRLPLIDWLNQLPGMSLGHPGRLRLVAIFAVAVLAGRGLDALSMIGAGERSRRWCARLLVGAAALAIGVALVFNVVLPLMSNWETRAISRYVDTFGGGDTPPRSAALCQARHEACASELGDAFSITNWEMYLTLPIAAGALLALWLAARRRGARPWLAPALVALATVELLVTGFGYNPAVDAALLDEEVPALTGLKRRAGGQRVTVLQQDMLPDAHMLFGLSDVRGLDFKTARYERYLDATGDRTPWIDNGVLLDDVGPLVTALGVRAVLTANPHIVEREVSEGSMRVAGNYGDLTIMEPVRPARRARLQFDAVVVDSDRHAAALLTEDSEAIQTRVILADGPVARAALEALGPEDPDATVSVTHDEAERVSWRVSTSEPALLVVSDSYYPGWKAAIDGEQVEIVRANIAFRAVLVPAGEHVVEMRYQPASFRYGWMLSLSALMFIIVVLALSWLPPLRRAR